MTMFCSLLFINVFFLFISVQIQDLRDVEGDSMANRQTCPIVYGMKNTRIISCVVVFFDIIRCFLQLVYTIFIATTNEAMCKVMQYYYTIGFLLFVIITEIYMIYRLLRPMRTSDQINVVRYDHYSYILIIFIYMQVIFSVSTLSYSPPQ